jgi:hypothetical protein
VQSCAFVTEGTRYSTGATKKDALSIKTSALIAKMKTCIRTAQASSGVMMSLLEATDNGRRSRKDMTITSQQRGPHTKTKSR